MRGRQLKRWVIWAGGSSRLRHFVSSRLNSLKYCLNHAGYASMLQKQICKRSTGTKLKIAYLLPFFVQYFAFVQLKFKLSLPQLMALILVHIKSWTFYLLVMLQCYFNPRVSRCLTQVSSWHQTTVTVMQYYKIYFFDKFNGRHLNRPFATNGHMAQNLTWR